MCLACTIIRRAAAGAEPLQTSRALRGGSACLQGVEPEARTFNTIIIACNLCGQPLQALEVSGSHAATTNLEAPLPQDSQLGALLAC